MPKVSKGLSTWAGLVGAVAGFLLALATFMDTFNELDPLAGLGPLAAAGLVLWKVIDGRMKQATALAAKAGPAQNLSFTTASGQGFSDATATLSRGIAANTAATEQNTVLAQAIADITSGQIVGSGVAGRKFTSGSGVEYAYSDDEPGDADALPDYATSDVLPPDVGDEHARPAEA